MANSNFVVQNGLQVGTLTMFAGNGDIITSGNISVTSGGSFGGLSSNQIYQSTSNVNVNGSSVTVGIGGSNVATFSSSGLTVNNITVTGTETVNNTEYVTTIDATTLRAVTIGNVGAAHVGSTGTFSGTVIAATVNAATIGNTGATLTGTLNTAAQTGITSVGTLTGLTTSGTIIAATVNAATIGNSGATLTGTISTAAQTSITSVGTLTGLTVSGAIVPNGNATVNIGSTSAYWNNAYVQALTATGITVNSGKILPGANAAIDIGSTTAWFNNIYGVATQAKYADLAENYQADKFYNPGTVLMFGGVQEVTVADADTTAVAGVVSTNPAHLMNGQLTGPNVVAVAFTGRVPCNVIGPVKKGDLMVSAGFGFAKASASPAVGQVIGKALQDFLVPAKGVIEVVVGRF